MFATREVLMSTVNNDPDSNVWTVTWWDFSSG